MLKNIFSPKYQEIHNKLFDHIFFYLQTNAFSLKNIPKFSSRTIYSFSTDQPKIISKIGNKFYRDTWIQVNLNHIAYNLQQIRNRLPKNKKIYAVVKANAYGHGDIEVSRKVLQSGADALAVAILDQAIKLRKAGFTVPILVMGWSRPEDAPLAAELNITVTVYQKQWIKEAKNYEFNNKLKVHIKVDTGMGRIGLRTKQELHDILKELKDWRFQLQGIFTHFAAADEEDNSYYHTQNKIFKQFLHQTYKKWDKPLIVHTGNSAATIRFPNDMYDYVRCGVAIYGLYPSKVVKEQKIIDLRQAMFLYSKLTHVKLLAKGESVSYGRTYKTSGDQWIGSIALGYADGFRRNLQGLKIIVDGKRMPIVGRVCMDQSMIKLDKQYPVGTKVTLLGQQGNQRIEIDEIADRIGTINYEVACMFGSRIPRVYIDDKKQQNTK